MATVTFIPGKTQSKTAMGRVVSYCSRKDKTFYEQDGRPYQLISGKDCCGETAFQEFMATKQQYGKANGTFFYQYVQSFSPDEKINLQIAHEIGCKFAEYFKGHEVLITTHTDVAHIHTHFVINSVNHENGKKLQMARGSIYDLRRFSDDICREYNLSIVEPKKDGLQNIRTREYRSALKGDSWKFKLMNVVDEAMMKSQTKAEFITNIRNMGYDVNWSDNRKHLTYTTPEGNKCRDNKMHDEKYLKHNMEVFYEYRTIKGFEQAGKPDRQLSDTSTDVRNPAGNTGTVANIVDDYSTGNEPYSRKNSTITHSREYFEYDEVNIGTDWQSNLESVGSGGAANKTRFTESNGNIEYGYSQRFIGTQERNRENAFGSGFDTSQVTDEVAGAGNVGNDDIVHIVKNIEHLINPIDPEKERQRREHEVEMKKQAQKRRKSRSWEMDM